MLERFAKIVNSSQNAPSQIFDRFLDMSDTNKKNDHVDCKMHTWTEEVAR